MARKELALQSEICKSVRAQGGYALKLSHRFAVGVPDLLIRMPLHQAMLVEVKDLGVVADEFSLKVPVTPKQREELKKFMCGSGQFPPPSFVLIGLRHKNRSILAFAPYRVEKFNYLYEHQPAIWVERNRLGPIKFDMMRLIEGLKPCP